MTGEKFRFPVCPGPAADISETICKDDAPVSWQRSDGAPYVPIDPLGSCKTASVEAGLMVDEAGNKLDLFVQEFEND